MNNKLAIKVIEIKTQFDNAGQKDKFNAVCKLRDACENGLMTELELDNYLDQIKSKLDNTQLAKEMEQAKRILELV